jgi:hypothetical protein
LNKRRKAEEEARKKKEMITRFVIAGIGAVALIIIGFFGWKSLSGSVRSNAAGPNQNSVLSYTKGNYKEIEVTITSKSGKDIPMNGFEGLESNCVTYVLLKSGYQVDPNLWINPDEVLPLLQVDYERNLLSTTIAWEQLIVPRIQKVPEGSLVLFFTFENGVEVAQHIAYVQNDHMLAQEFGFLDNEEILAPTDVLARLIDERADFADAHIEIWTPK